MSRLAAVTGATGFLGRRLVPLLEREGWRVRVLARDPAARWTNAAPEVVAGALSDGDALHRLCDGADAVIHAAGLIKAPSPQAFRAANLDGAEAVARAAGTLAPVIMVSSLAAREPQLSPYATSKRGGEDAMRAVLGDRLTVLRPPAIYGPGDAATLPLFRFASWSPVLPVLGLEGSRLALVHVDDVVRQIAALTEAHAPGVFALGGARPEGYGWREMLLAIAAAVGRRPALAPVPATMTRLAAAMSGLVAGLTGRAAIFNPGKASELLHLDWSVSAAELPPTAVRPGFDLAAGFADAVAWYRANGLLGPGRPPGASPEQTRG